MMNRRALIAGGLAVGAAGAVSARPPSAAKRRAIDAIALPPGFNGALAYGRSGRIEHVRHVGLADIEAGRAVSGDTRFKWGSASKWLTSVAVMRLVEQKRLSIEAPISTYLPGFRRDTGDRVRLGHLLSNTSGITDLFARQVASEPELRYSTATAAAIVMRFGAGDLAFAPGEGWDYAALNWIIVAALLERVTGEPVPQLIGRLVLRPLGLADTGFAQVDQPPMPQLAAAYASVAPPVRKTAPVPPFLVASGNAASNVHDAIRAAHGVFHGPLLSAASRQALTTIRWPAEDYALGGRVHAIDGDAWAWESGKVQGYRAHIAHRLAASETIVLFNTTDMAQTPITTWVESIARA